jgi:hypothetical protein
MILKSALIGATAIAIALTGFDLRPTVAAPLGGPAITQQPSDATDFSAARKRRYRGNPGAPLAAFGAIVGTIGAIAAANSRREYYESPYYGGPAYGYYDAPPAYHYNNRPVYQRPFPQHDYYSRWGGSGGQPGYRGPNVNVPGPTNYGNAAGQNGQAPPLAPGPPSSGSN